MGFFRWLVGGKEQQAGDGHVASSTSGSQEAGQPEPLLLFLDGTSSGPLSDARTQAGDLAQRCSADQLKSQARQLMQAQQWEEALPFALAETILSRKHSAVARVATCCQQMTEAAVREQRFSDTERAYLDYAIQAFDIVAGSGWEEAGVFTLRGAAYSLRGQLDRNLDDLREAERSFRRAIELDPSDPVAARNLAGITEVLRRMG